MQQEPSSKEKIRKKCVQIAKMKFLADKRIYPYMPLPGDYKELLKLFGNGIIHPAMKMAYTALNMKRSPNQVFILLVGLTGAGKSTTVNYLFETQIADTSESMSKTRATTEYVVQMTSEEWRIENMTMSIIDTPGMGDTVGLLQDAKNIMSIKYFLARYPNFTDVFPNLIFIVASIHDNRIVGAGSQFAKMLSGVNDLNVVDKNNPNVIVILTHAAGIAKKREIWIEKVSKKKEEVKAIVEGHLGITPEIVVQENAPDDFEMEKIEDWHILPDGEKQPKVLFETCSRILNSSKDEIGHEAVAVCFRPGENKNVTVGISMNSADVASTDSQTMYEKLEQTLVSSVNSEVGKMLDEYEKSLQNPAVHNDILILKNKLKGMNINTVKDIQSLTMNSLVERMYPIRMSGRMDMILSQVFGLKYVQMFGLDCPVGSGYNIFMDGKSYMKPIIMKGSGNKYGLPDNVDITTATTHTVTCQSIQTNEEYINERLQDFNLHIHSKVKYDAFKMKMRAGYSMMSSLSRSEGQKSNESSFVIEKPIYKLSVKQPYEIDPMLKEDIQKLPDSINLANEDTVNSFKSFFDKWGYYVITGLFIGGSLSGSIITKGHTSSKDACAEAKLTLGLQLSFLQNKTALDSATMDEVSTRKTGTSELSSTSLQWNGGDRDLHKDSLEAINPDEWNRWLISLEHSPAALWKSLDLYPLHLLAEKVSIEKSKLIQIATNIALTGTFEYIPKQVDNRENTAKSNESGACFPGETTITLHDGTIKCMRDASVGDIVLTIDENGFIKKDAIITWIHKVPEGQFRFIKIKHNQGIIKITPEHIIFVGSSSAARQASTVIPGEELHFFNPEGNNKSSTLVTVLSIEEVTGTGIYAPLTLNGRLLVDGVAASCYCSLRPIQVARKTLVSAHSLAHFGFLPMRVAHIIGIDLNNKIDRETGIHLYAKWLKERFFQYLS